MECEKLEDGGEAGDGYWYRDACAVEASLQDELVHPVMS